MPARNTSPPPSKVRCADLGWSVVGNGPLTQLNTKSAARVDRIRAARDQLGRARCVGAIAWLRRHPAGIVPTFDTGKRPRKNQSNPDTHEPERHRPNSN